MEKRRVTRAIEIIRQHTFGQKKVSFGLNDPNDLQSCPCELNENVPVFEGLSHIDT
jgi:hypothetical protein